MRTVENGKTGYMRAHYDVTGYCQNTSLNDSIICRLRNALVEPMNKQVLLPKAIVLIFEQDIMNHVNYFKTGFSSLMTRLLEWIANQIHRLLTAHKERLPSKSRKFRYPTVLWTLLPEHYAFGDRNEYRVKFNTCVQSVTSLFREMTILKPEWDELDMGLINKQIFTSRGYLVYWQSVNKAFENWDKGADEVNAQSNSARFG